jgi:hypothetical protein
LSKFDSVLLGDNSFYGIDHLSHERARERTKTVQSIDNAIDVIKTAYSMGIDGMVVANRPKLKEIITILEHDSDIVKKLDFYPIIPYAQGLQMKLSQGGVMGTMKEIIKAGSIKKDLKILAKGGFSFMKKDFIELFKIFIDVELIKLQNVEPKMIYLHPVLTDLALAFNMKNVFETFQNYLHDNYQIKSGVCTKNFPQLISKFGEWEMNYDSIMTSFNKSGYLMNPSRKECEKSLENYNGHVLAMNLFAGGLYSLDETAKYVESLPKIKNIVIGLSSTKHAKETFDRFINK